MDAMKAGTLFVTIGALMMVSSLVLGFVFLVEGATLHNTLQSGGFVLVLGGAITARIAKRRLAR
jgi:hypothetical protein